MKVILDVEAIGLIAQVLLSVTAAHNNPECHDFGKEIEKLKMLLENATLFDKKGDSNDQ